MQCDGSKINLSKYIITQEGNIIRKKTGKTIKQVERNK